MASQEPGRVYAMPDGTQVRLREATTDANGNKTWTFQVTAPSGAAGVGCSLALQGHGSFQQGLGGLGTFQSTRYLSIFGYSIRIPRLGVGRPNEVIKITAAAGPAMLRNRSYTVLLNKGKTQVTPNPFRSFQSVTTGELIQRPDGTLVLMAASRRATTVWPSVTDDDLALVLTAQGN